MSRVGGVAVSSAMRRRQNASQSAPVTPPGAGVAARPEILEEFGHKIRYFNTFGGNSVCIAAAAAVLDVIETEGTAAP